MKRWLMALTAIAVVSLACVPLALAAGHPGTNKGQMKGHAKFQCEATIVSVDTSGLLATPQTPALLTVTVKSSSKTMKWFHKHAQQPVVQVALTAKLIDATVDPAAPLDISKLAAGDKVHLGGTIAYGSTPTQPMTWTITAARVVLQKVPVTTP